MELYAYGCIFWKLGLFQPFIALISGYAVSRRNENIYLLANILGEGAFASLLRSDSIHLVLTIAFLDIVSVLASFVYALF